MEEVITKVPLNRILHRLLGNSQLVHEWWHRPNRAFNDDTPDEVYQSGEEGRRIVYNYIMFQVDYHT